MNEQALKARIKEIAKNKNKSFYEVWKLLVLERFLVRLGKSPYNSKLIFKGGLLLSYYIDILRETIDVDLLARKLIAEKDNITHIINEISNVSVDDGFQLTYEHIEDLDHAHMNYPGFRVKLSANFGNMKDRFQLDIGVGDTVEPVKIDWPLFEHKKRPLFSDDLSLMVYPVETIFAEKLETVISRGGLNSRMKDFHDLYLLCKSDQVMDAKALVKNINATFSNRSTDFKMPIQFDDKEMLKLNNMWKRHLQTLGKEVVEALELPSSLVDIIDELNQYLIGIDLNRG